MTRKKERKTDGQIDRKADPAPLNACISEKSLT